MVSWSSLTSNGNVKWILAGAATAAGIAFGVCVFLERSKKQKMAKEEEEESKLFELVGTVSALNIYPIKSCGGIASHELFVTRSGVKSGDLKDRHFLITRANGDFLTQRQIAMMSAVTTTIEGGELVLSAQSMKKSLRVPLTPASDRSKIRSCRVWGSNVEGHDLGEEASKWISEILKENDLRLVTFMPGMTKRQSSKGSSLPVDKVAYQDDSPFLVATESSLASVVAQVPTSPDNQTVTMTNFRPNIVVRGTKAWEEDGWAALKIGDRAKLRITAPCDRCLLTTVDPDQHERRADGEPLKTLKTFRIFPEISKTSPMFGVFAGADVEAPIRVGDPVYARRK